MRSLWHLGGLSWPKLAIRAYRQAMRDQLLGRAAELSYFFLFSVFPLLLFLTTLLGYVARGNDELRRELFSWLATVSPSTAITQLLQDTVDSISDARGGGKLSVGLIAAVWVASNGMLAIGRTLNTACGLRETRPFWLRRLHSVALVGVFAFFVVAALALVFFGEWIAEWIAGALGLGGGFAWIWSVTQWGVVIVFVVLAFDMVYNYAPNLARRHHVWITPGASIGVGLWLAVSFGLRLYLTEFPRYEGKVYGSLGAIILMLLWFYLTAASILVGGEINSEIAVAARGAEAAREERSRAPRRRGSDDGEEAARAEAGEPAAAGADGAPPPRRRAG